MHGHIESCYLQYMKRKERVLDNIKQFSGPPNAKNLTKYKSELAKAAVERVYFAENNEGGKKRAYPVSDLFVVAVIIMKAVNIS